MNQFLNAFIEGINHIFCLDALDHILFLLALCAAYDSTKMKKVFLLVTAFTIGHALAFLAVVMDIVPPVRSWSEKAIPITIIITGIMNWLKSSPRKTRKEKGIFWIYVLAIFFGGIHGMAISLEFKMKAVPGISFWPQVLGMNIGVEAAQLAVVAIILFCQMLLMSMFRVSMVNWKNVTSGIVIGAALIILMNKF